MATDIPAHLDNYTKHAILLTFQEYIIRGMSADDEQIGQHLKRKIGKKGRMEISNPFCSPDACTLSATLMFLLS